VRISQLTWALRGGGELIDLPGGPVTLGLGMEYNSQDYVSRVDNYTATFDVIGLGAAINGIGKRYWEIGSWTTLDWQISYAFGRPVEITLETPKPGFDKDGKKLAGTQRLPKPSRKVVLGMVFCRSDFYSRAFVSIRG
jgi:hypothetical protein